MGVRLTLSGQEDTTFQKKDKGKIMRSPIENVGKVFNRWFDFEACRLCYFVLFSYARLHLDNGTIQNIVQSIRMCEQLDWSICCRQCQFLTLKRIETLSRKDFSISSKCVNFQYTPSFNSQRKIKLRKNAQHWYR